MEEPIEIYYGMNSNEIRLSNERVDLIKKIRKLTKEFNKEQKRKNPDKNKIDDLKSQVNYHIFAMNKITDKLYGSGE